MSEKEKILLIGKVQNNLDKESLDLLVSSHKGLVYELALKCTSSNPRYFEDVMQEGNIALIEAIKIHKNGINCKFSTFAYSVIRNQILNYIYRQNLANRRIDSSVELEELHSLPNMSSGLKPFIFKHINKSLGSIESLIIKWKFGLDNETWYTTEEISKITSLSTRRVDQIIETSLDKLKNSIEKESKFNTKNLFLG